MNNYKFDQEALSNLPTANDLLNDKYGKRGTQERHEFNAKALAWGYAEILREKRKDQNMTQKELAERTGIKREYIAQLERGETDMQLSTFLNLSEALGMQFELISQ